MTSVVIFALEGVLQSDGGRPIEAGCRLYRTLRTGLLYQVLVISSAEEDTARRFFGHQHMSAPAAIQAAVQPNAWDWMLACNMMRRQYPFEIDFAVVPDPEISSVLYREGFRVLLWTDPRYMRQEFRPDAKPRESSWHKMAAELADDRKLIASDDRLIRE